MCVRVSVPRCCRRCFSGRVESWDLTSALSPSLSVLSAARQVHPKHLFHLSLPPLFTALPFLHLPFVFSTLSSSRSPALYFNILLRLSKLFFFIGPLFCFVYLSSSICSLLAPLLFVLMINCRLQAENEVLVWIVAGVCFCTRVRVFVACYAHFATAEDIPESSCPILKKHTHTHTVPWLICAPTRPSPYSRKQL